MILSLHLTGGGGKMGGKRSFHIESKRFDLSLDGNQVQVSESGRQHVRKIYCGLAGAKWIGQCVEENIVRERDQAFVRTCSENGKTYVSRRCSNDHGRYIEITECGRGGSRGRVVIPEGRKQNGWRGFGKELQWLLSLDNGPGHPHGPRQHRDVGVGREKPRISVEVAVEAKGKSTYADVVGKGIPAKSEHVVPPPQVPEFDRGSSISKSKSQTIP